MKKEVKDLKFIMDLRLKQTRQNLLFFQTLQKIYLIHLENSSKDQLEKNMGLMV